MIRGIRPTTDTRLARVLRRSFVLVSVLLTATACSTHVGGEPAASETELLHVVAEFSILADFAVAIGGERVEVETVVPLGGDPHAYEPRPNDARRIAEADLVLEHGLGLSPWMRPLARNAQGPVVTVADVVADRAVRDEDGLVDPHLWMAPPFTTHYLDAIADALAAVDPGGEATFDRNAKAYRSELHELDDDLRTAFATIPIAQRRLVTPHDAYGYFADHYDLDVLGTLVGVTSEEEPSARRVRELVDAVRASEVPAVFVEATVPPRQIERVAQEAGVEVAGPLFGDSVGEAGSGAEDYLSMMRANAATIVDALGGEQP